MQMKCTNYKQSILLHATSYLSLNIRKTSKTGLPNLAEYRCLNYDIILLDSAQY